MQDQLETLALRVQSLETQLADLKSTLPEDKLSMVVFSGDLDRMLAAFIIATGAAAMYEKVVMFFTFWGTAAMRDLKKEISKSELTARMFDKMLPRGPAGLKLSKMNFAGLGTAMMKSLMKKKGVLTLEDLMLRAGESGVQIYICEMSMDLMGFKADEMIDYPHIHLAGVAKFLQEAAESRVSLFI